MRTIRERKEYIRSLDWWPTFCERCRTRAEECIGSEFRRRQQRLCNMANGIYKQRAVGQLFVWHSTPEGEDVWSKRNDVVNAFLDEL